MVFTDNNNSNLYQVFRFDTIQVLNVRICIYKYVIPALITDYSFIPRQIY